MLTNAPQSWVCQGRHCIQVKHQCIEYTHFMQYKGKKNILHSCILSCCNNFVLVWHINKILLIVSIWCELHVILMHATFHHWITLFHLHKYIKLTNTNCAKLNFHSLKLQYTHPFYFLYFKHCKYKIIYVYRFFLYRHLFM